jgi:hypothetical protein
LFTNTEVPRKKKLGEVRQCDSVKVVRNGLPEEAKLEKDQVEKQLA